MADAKLQVVRTSLPNKGIDHTDMRGSKFVGSPVDEHRTIAERRIPDEASEAFLRAAHEFNKAIAVVEDYMPAIASDVAGLLGLPGSGAPVIRLRLYDND